jgi:hypothetical protein
MDRVVMAEVKATVAAGVAAGVAAVVVEVAEVAEVAEVVEVVEVVGAEAGLPQQRGLARNSHLSNSNRSPFQYTVQASTGPAPPCVLKSLSSGL